MSRKIRMAALAVFAAVAFGTTACADLTGPETNQANFRNNVGSGT